ncbi:MAG: O-antigen ligase family protein, partial [Aquihabitans sp.]
GPTLAIGLAGATAGLGVLGAAEALGWEPRLLDVGSRLTGPLGSSAYLGAALALLWPAAVGIAVDSSLGRRTRVLAGVGVAGGLVGVLGSGARAAWVGLLVAGLVVALVRRAWLRSLLTRARGNPLATGLGVAVALVAIVAVVLLSPVGGRAGSLFDADAPGGSGRVDEWRVAARVLADHPVTGVGPEGYRIAFGRFVDADYEVAHGRDQLPDRAHSGPLDVALSGGIGALAAWVLVLGLVARSAWRVMRRGRPWLVGIAVGLVAHWVGQLFLFPLAELEPVAWLLAGLVVVEGAVPGDLRSTRVSSRVVVTVGLVAWLVAVVGGVSGVAGLTADRRAEQAVQALVRGDNRVALATADAATIWRPDVVRYRLLDARVRTNAGEGAISSLDAVDSALAVSPKDPIARLARVRYLVARAVATEIPAHARLARLAADELLRDDSVNGALWLLSGEAARLDGDAQGAERAWLHAEHLRPHDAEPATNLAVLYWDRGDEPAAAKAIARALAADPADQRALSISERVSGG